MPGWEPFGKRQRRPGVKQNMLLSPTRMNRPTRRALSSPSHDKLHQRSLWPAWRPLQCQPCLALAWLIALARDCGLEAALTRISSDADGRRGVTTASGASSVGCCSVAAAVVTLHYPRSLSVSGMQRKWGGQSRCVDTTATMRDCSPDPTTYLLRTTASTMRASSTITPPSVRPSPAARDSLSQS